MATAKMSLAQEFIDEYGERNAPAAFARGLMAGDAASFKAGYTANNAFLATADAFELSDDEKTALAGAIDATIWTQKPGVDRLVEARAKGAIE
jgi:hypothetical protein